MTALREEQASRETEQRRYRDLLDLVPVATLMTTPAGLIEVANRAAADLLGVPADWLIGKPLAAYIMWRTGVGEVLQPGSGSFRTRPTAHSCTTCSFEPGGAARSRRV